MFEVKKSDVAKWFAELTAAFGENIADWPSIGCGAGFKAWSNGPSMVIEILIDSAEDRWKRSYH